MDCFFESLDKMFPKISKTDIILSSGIANKIRITNYNNIDIKTVDGRGYRNPITFIEKTQIPYFEITLDELFSLSYYKNIMIIAPKNLLENIAILNPNLRQLAYFYSVFYIQNISNNGLTLCLPNDNTCFINAHKEDLKKLESIKTTPLKKSIYIVSFEDVNYKFEERDIICNLVESVESFISNKNFYSVLSKLFFDAKSYTTKIEYLKQYFLISSINAGSIGMYRQDFAENLYVLFEWLNINPESIIEDLGRSSNGWRHIGRELRKVQIDKKNSSQLFYEQLNDVLYQIKTLELDSMEKIYEILKERE